MNKSQMLDELRLEIGLVPEYATTVKEFYIGIVKAIGSRIRVKYGVGIYEMKGSHFQMLCSMGSTQHRVIEPFDDSPFSTSAIRGNTFIHTNNNYRSIISPFYNGHHLIGFIVIDLPERDYFITEEDVIFVKEVSRFIEVQHNRYSNSYL
ncbi:hypothetical protein [Bacillus sp. FJAT-45350]|uniref:hypothetical protein n=1 Tax=Bacillus sp. FJAT-45350 TaxID=2011014 RepID=UPI000BB69E06|nr:hypothetical protein [Bacillus sp. FJAT-45350]